MTRSRPSAHQGKGTSGGSLYALIYPIAVSAVCFVLAQFLMPETRHLAIRRASGVPHGRGVHVAIDADDVTFVVEVAEIPHAIVNDPAPAPTLTIHEG